MSSTFDIIKQDFVDHQNGLMDEMQEMITEEKRPFPNQTKRRYGRGKTGKDAGSPRDAVDSGKTRDSFKKTITDRGDSIEAEAQWNSQGAEKVYYGVNQPPFPWIKHVLRRDRL